MADRRHDTLAAARPGAELAVGLAAALRRAGLAVPVGATVELARALDAVGLDRRHRVHAAARAVVVRRPEDHRAFDAGFAAFWDGAPLAHAAAPAPPPPVPLDRADGGAAPPGAAGPAGAGAVRYSAVEVLRHKDLAACSTDELDEVRRLMVDMRLAAALHPSRRRRAARRGKTDLRRTVRRALRSGGEVIRPLHRTAVDRPRRLVVLADVSGSMDPYARTILRFLHGAVAGPGRVEAFAVGTRTTRLTRELSSRDPDAALAAAAAAVPDWSGGTRLGEGLRWFLDTWGARGLARGAVVVVVSDGWDRGDPDVLGEQMARLSRIAHRVVWVNPLKASAGYAPLAAGMAAALPHVDDFLPGHSLAALEDLAAAVSRPDRARP